MDAPGSPRYPALEAFFRQHGAPREARRGEVLVRRDMAQTSLFYIEAGFVKAYALNVRGDQHLHMIYGPGEYFPLLYVERTARRGLVYETLVASQLLEVAPATLEATLGAQRQLSRELLQLAAAQCALGLERIHHLQYRFARERLIACLLSLAERFGMGSDASYEIMVRLSHQALASKVNLSRESVSREIDRLMRKGLVQVREGRIVLIDVPALRAQLPEAPSDNWWEFLGQANMSEQ